MFQEEHSRLSGVQPSGKTRVRNMKMEEKLLERRIHKLLLITLKVIPMLLALCAVIGMLLDFFDHDASLCSFIGSVSLLPLIFLYLASYAFRFCGYHRMFLHYIVANNILVYLDYYIGLPISNRSLLIIHLAIVGLFLFLVLYFYRKEKCCKR